MLEREHGNATPGVDTSSTSEVLVRSEYMDCSSVTSDGDGDKECPDHLKLTISEADLTVSQYKEAVQLLKENQDVFVGPDGKVGYTKLVKHKIDTGSVKPFKMPVRRMGPAQREILNKEWTK